MAIREKLRRHLTRTTSASDPNALTTTATSDSKKSKSSKQKAAKDPNRYAPGEMPKPKYRGPYNKAHQEKLHAFSFGEALDNARRKSSQSQYSPRGSKMPSRRGSLVGRFLGGNKRTGSKSGEEGLRESEKEEGGVENVGLSRQHTHDSAPSQQQHPQEATTLGSEKTLTNGVRHDTPFTEEELTRALTKSTLKPSALEAKG
ncbi:hypothetical protein MMC20_000529 [Loxospora ochrophaea]|nr:hypothetical protein [Loxospora ochrophaea]